MRTNIDCWQVADVTPHASEGGLVLEGRSERGFTYEDGLNMV